MKKSTTGQRGLVSSGGYWETWTQLNYPLHFLGHKPQISQKSDIHHPKYAKPLKTKILNLIPQTLTPKPQA